MLTRLLLSLSALSATAAGQSVRFTKITDETTVVRGHGDRPALHDGLVAFFGENAATEVNGIYVTPADGSGPFTLLVDQNTSIPNVPGESFLFLDNPAVRDGVVAFTGGHQLRFPHIKDGIYLADGGPLGVLYDAAADFSIPSPTSPALGPHGVSFRTEGDRGAAYFHPFEGDYYPPGDSLPGGGALRGLTRTGNLPAFGGGQLAFSAEVLHDSELDQGVYTFDVVSRTTDLVANWNTTVPGAADRFEYFGSADTDGYSVAFTGQVGLLGFGGYEGVYRAPLGATGNGPLTQIAMTDDPAPGSAERFGAFDSVAVDGELLLFGATLGAPANPAGFGIYGWYRGTLFKVIDTQDALAGEELVGFAMHFRGLDQDQLVFRAAFLDPENPSWQTRFGLFVADFDDLSICQENLGYGGPGNSMHAVCGDPLLPAGTATLTLDRAPSGAPALLFAALAEDPVPFAGGRLVPFPPSAIISLRADGTGHLELPVTHPGVGPLDVTTQFVVVDPASPTGIGLSNAVRIRFLP